MTVSIVEACETGVDTNIPWAPRKPAQSNMHGCLSASDIAVRNLTISAYFRPFGRAVTPQYTVRHSRRQSTVRVYCSTVIGS
jgi:hypothetical protein